MHESRHWNFWVADDLTAVPPSLTPPSFFTAGINQTSGAGASRSKSMCMMKLSRAG